MGDFVTAFTADVTAADLWTAVAPAAAIVGLGVVVGFAYYLLRRAISGIGKGKGKI